MSCGLCKGGGETGRWGNGEGGQAGKAGGVGVVMGMCGGYALAHGNEGAAQTWLDREEQEGCIQNGTATGHAYANEPLFERQGP